ncbi:hypothetical protein BDV10DRAFT_184590 [Aspergillus recurvatus]
MPARFLSSSSLSVAYRLFWPVGWQESPGNGEAIPTDAFTVAWGYKPNEVSSKELTIEIELTPTEAAQATTLTTKVDATESTTVLPPSFLPAMRPGENSPIILTLRVLWWRKGWGWNY